jgi:hypothetical protein
MMKVISAAGRQYLKGGIIEINKFLQFPAAGDNNHCLSAITYFLFMPLQATVIFFFEDPGFPNA